jgi:formate dehydrogenase subunit delta
MSEESRSVDHLVRMANDIGHFFASEPKRSEAIAGIANHIQRGWAPRMLRQIIAHVKNGGAGLDELPREAVALLKVPEAPAGVGPLAAAAAGAATRGTGTAPAVTATTDPRGRRTSP